MTRYLSLNLNWDSRRSAVTDTTIIKEAKANQEIIDSMMATEIHEIMGTYLKITHKNMVAHVKDMSPKAIHPNIIKALPAHMRILRIIIPNLTSVVARDLP